MKTFKNLLPQAEFKSIYEDSTIQKNLESYDKIYEDMDFSNRTGFSESLVGRAINKIFSFAAKLVEYAILGKLKKQFDDELKKATMVAIDLMGLDIKKSQEQSFDSLFSGVLEYTSEKTIEESSSASFVMTKILKLQREQQESYLEIEKLQIEIQKIRNKKTLEKQNKDTQTQDAQAQGQSTATQDQDIAKIILFKKGKDEQENLNNQVATIKSLIGKIIVNDIKTNNNSGMLAVISSKLAQEIKTIKDENSKTELEKFKLDIDNKIKSFKEPKMDEETYKKRKESYSEVIKGENINYKKLLEDLLKKITNNFTSGKYKDRPDLKKVYRELTMLLHPDKYSDANSNISVDDLKKMLDKANELIKEHNLILENNILEEYIKLFEEAIFSKLYEDEQTGLATTSQPQTQSNKAQIIQDDEDDEEIITMKAKIETLNIKIKKFKETITEEQKLSMTSTFNKKTTIKQSLKLNLGDSSQTKQSYEKFKDSEEISCDLIMKSIDEKYKDETKIEEAKKKFIEIVIKSVNSETLKVIALKAVMLYDRENYKDARSHVYSRVNFSTTHPDKVKIENKWLQMISNVKAKYMLCFSTIGTWPNSIDPIGLMNSDKKLRENFNEYGPEAKDAIKNGDTTDNKTNTTKCQMEKLGLTSSNEFDEEDDVFIIFEKKGMEFEIGVLFEKLEEGFFVKSIFAYDKILTDLKDCSETTSSDDIEKILKQNRWDISYSMYDDADKQRLEKFKEIIKPSDKTIYYLSNKSLSKSMNQFYESNINQSGVLNFRKFNNNKKLEDIITDDIEINSFSGSTMPLSVTSFYKINKENWGDIIEKDSNGNDYSSKIQEYVDLLKTTKLIEKIDELKK